MNRRDHVVPAKILAIMLFSLAFAHHTASAQYFGRNKVEYDNFHFEVLHTDHFDIYFYPEEQDAARYAAKMAERWYTRHSRVFGDTLHGRQPLILYESHPQFEETNTIQGALSEGVGGVTEPLKRRIILPFAGPLQETDHVIGHELVHAFQYDITGQGQPGGAYRLPSAERLPLWFIEGMAEYFSLGPVDPNTAMWMRDAAVKKLPSVSDLENPTFFPYRYGQALLAYIGSRWGDKTVARLLRVAGKRGDLNSAIDSVLLIKPDSLSKAWHAAVHAQYDSLLHQTKQPKDYGPLLIAQKSGGGELNVSPVLSPDGRKVVFFSEKDLFSIDLYLADAVTGKITRNLVRAELDPHFQSLEFINSAGAWDKSGRKFVFAAVSKGRPTLTILDVEKGETDHEIRFPSIGEIFNPSWSPDGRSIVFSALTGGVSDLFLYDFRSDSLHRLTHDVYTDLQPAWSPDGKTIAFVTDRFSTDLHNLNIGSYQLALMDVETGKSQPLPSFEHAKNINPQWSPDGKSLYFVSDRGGISNIYRLDMASGKISQLTDLYVGVSGITSLSPALSVASSAHRLVYSTFEEGKYNIYAIDSLGVHQGVELTRSPAVLHPAELSPLNRNNAMLVDQLANASLGLPPDSSFSVSDYHPSLSLDGVGQASLGGGADQFGTYFGGGVSLLWSDMLGNENLLTGLQIQSGGGFSLSDFSAMVGYLNTSGRLNWGAVIQQYPFITASYLAGYAYVNGEPSYLEQQYIYRQIDREVSGVVSYPFSQVLRVEFSLGYQNISFQEEVDTRGVSLNTGLVTIDESQNLPHDSALNLATTSAALVYDNSISGATGPILGERYRLEVSPVVGSLSWAELLADYRHYFMPIRPFTIAARVLHLGRYGRSAEDDRLSPLFLGYPGLLRGYDINSFDASECSSDSAGSCIIDRIAGSRIIVGNVELRFPLLGVLGIGRGYYGFLPIEAALFYDAGVAWDSNDAPWFTGGPRKPVSSTGAALRINLFGLVGEVDYVHPFDRPGKDWLWQFNLTPGF